MGIALYLKVTTKDAEEKKQNLVYVHVCFLGWCMYTHQHYTIVAIYGCQNG